MPTDDNELRMRLLAETRAELLKRQLSNAENFDKAILTLSTAALGLSFALLKDFIPIASAKLAWALYGSWYAFTGALVATILSYFASQHAIPLQLENADEYYSGRSVDPPPKTRSAILTDWLNCAAGALFVVGVVLTTLFVSLNIEGASVSSNKTSPSAPIPPMQRVPVERGAPIPEFQKVEKGAPIPDFQKVPQPQPATQPVAPVTQPAKTDGTNSGKQ